MSDCRQESSLKSGDDCLVVIAKGIGVGRGTFQAEAVQADGRAVSSATHQIQVFAPLRLRPRRIALLPDSLVQVRITDYCFASHICEHFRRFSVLFQLEATGGPQPRANLVYSVNESGVVHVSEWGLIETVRIGLVKVTGRILASESPKKQVVLSEVSDLFCSEILMYLSIADLFFLGFGSGTCGAVVRDQDLFPTNSGSFRN